MGSSLGSNDVFTLGILESDGDSDGIELGEYVMEGKDDGDEVGFVEGNIEGLWDGPDAGVNHDKGKYGKT